MSRIRLIARVSRRQFGRQTAPCAASASVACHRQADAHQRRATPRNRVVAPCSDRHIPPRAPWSVSTSHASRRSASADTAAIDDTAPSRGVVEHFSMPSLSPSVPNWPRIAIRPASTTNLCPRDPVYRRARSRRLRVIYQRSPIAARIKGLSGPLKNAGACSRRARRPPPIRQRQGNGDQFIEREIGGYHLIHIGHTGIGSTLCLFSGAGSMVPGSGSPNEPSNSAPPALPGSRSTENQQWHPLGQRRRESHPRASGSTGPSCVKRWPPPSIPRRNCSTNSRVSRRVAAPRHGRLVNGCWTRRHSRSGGMSRNRFPALARPGIGSPRLAVLRAAVVGFLVHFNAAMALMTAGTRRRMLRARRVSTTDELFRQLRCKFVRRGKH